MIAATSEVIVSVNALPAHLVGSLRDPSGFAEATTGEVVVLERRGHSVHVIDRTRTRIRRILDIGSEIGKIIEPGVISLGPNDIFAIADAPGGFERVQYFSLTGTRIGGFYLPRRTTPRWVVGGIVLNGVGSLQFTGRTFLLSLPNSGALISELDIDGNVLRRIGLPRPTGREDDAALHQALNIGFPLADPTGGFYFVFQTGAPMFRKYDADGALMFERHIEGPELDVHILSLPTIWPERPSGGGTLPVVPALVQTAAVDSAGRLFVSLGTSHTYVYDRTGEKIRVLQLRGAGILTPTSLSFSPRTGHLIVSPGGYEFDVK